MIFQSDSGFVVGERVGLCCSAVALVGPQMILLLPVDRNLVIFGSLLLVKDAGLGFGVWGWW